MSRMKPIVCFACVHIGHEDTDLKLAHEYVRWVKENDAYALLLADNHECALPHKGHMMFSQNMKPHEQLDYGIQLFKPIAKNIIGACTGNHAARARKVAGIDLDKVMADRLGYLHCYFPFQGFITASVGKQEYKIAFKHGNGVGSDTFRNCKDLLRSYPTVDVCATSHTHQLATTKHNYWDLVSGKRQKHEVTFVSSGSLLNYPEYADEAGYSPQTKGFAILWVDPREKHVSVDVSGRI